MYVKRNAQGQIEAVSQVRASDFDELMPEGSPELMAFLGAGHDGKELLAATDTELVRVLEDLIDLLVDRDVIRFTDLPDAAQKKLLSRRDTRVTLREGLQLLDDDLMGGLP